MKEITLTINGTQVKGKEGSTVLEVCRANGIDVPTLCHLDGLSDVGACRLCVVEIEKERRPVPSCAYPARDGLVVKTHTPELEKHRRLMLELIFTERNHFCMFCEKSGDCELQALAYQYQMDHVRYPYTFPTMPVDPFNENIVIDHNRCILCGRCVRACNEVTGVHAIDFAKRGYRTMVSADLEQPLGESSCTSCGACVQACPTGAILSKFSLYKGKTEKCQVTETVCPLCGAGCELKVFTNDNNPVRIESPLLNGSKSSLCAQGRFGLVYDPRPRVISAMVRRDGELEESSLDKALEVVASRLGGKNGSLAALVSTRYPTETLAAFKKLVQDVFGSQNVDTLNGSSYRAVMKGISQFDSRKGLNIECSAGELAGADCILVAGADPFRTNPAVGSMVLQAVHRGAKLIVIDPSRDVLPLWSTLWLRPEVGSEGVLFRGLAKLIIDKGLAKAQNLAGIREAVSDYTAEEVVKTAGITEADLEKAAAILGGAKAPVIIYGQGVLERKDPGIVKSLLDLASLSGVTQTGALRVISLKQGGNSRAAWDMGLAAHDVRRDTPKAVFVLLGDEPGDDELIGWLKGAEFVVVQASHQSAVTALASVVLPSPAWSEREGTYVSLDGTVGKAKRVVQPAKGAPQDSDIFNGLAKKLGRSLS